MNSRNPLAGLLFTATIAALFLLALTISLPATASAVTNVAAIETLEIDIMACLQPGVAGEVAKQMFSRKYSVPFSKVDTNITSRKSANESIDAFRDANTCRGMLLTPVGVRFWEDYAAESLSPQSSNITIFNFCFMFLEHCRQYGFGTAAARSCIKQQL